MSTSIRFCRAFPDNKVHHPYYILFGEGDFNATFISQVGLA